MARGYEDVDGDEENENKDEDEEDEDDKMMSMKSMRLAKAEATPAGTTQFSYERRFCKTKPHVRPAETEQTICLRPSRCIISSAKTVFESHAQIVLFKRHQPRNRRDMIFEWVEQDSANTFRLFWTENLRNLVGRTHRTPDLQDIWIRDEALRKAVFFHQMKKLTELNCNFTQKNTQKKTEHTNPCKVFWGATSPKMHVQFLFFILYFLASVALNSKPCKSSERFVFLCLATSKLKTSVLRTRATNKTPRHHNQNSSGNKKTNETKIAMLSTKQWVQHGSS